MPLWTSPSKTGVAGLCSAHRKLCRAVMLENGCPLLSAGDLNENSVENEDEVLTLSITSRAFLPANFGRGGLVQ